MNYCFDYPWNVLCDCMLEWDWVRLSEKEQEWNYWWNWWRENNVCEIAPEVFCPCTFRHLQNQKSKLNEIVSNSNKFNHFVFNLVWHLTEEEKKNAREKYKAIYKNLIFHYFISFFSWVQKKKGKEKEKDKINYLPCISSENVTKSSTIRAAIMWMK